jgi:hypothetical protein
MPIDCGKGIQNYDGLQQFGCKLPEWGANIKGCI